MKNMRYRTYHYRKFSLMNCASGVRHLNSEGFTLVELLAIISVIGILVGVLVFSFQQWNSGYIVESQIKEIHMDLMNSRVRAMQRNRIHFVNLSATQYTIYEDTDPAPDGNGQLTTAADVVVSQNTLNVRYPIISTNAQIEFDKNGFSNNDNIICSNAIADADYDCIAISVSRINMGQLTTAISDGGACNAANCIEK